MCDNRHCLIGVHWKALDPDVIRPKTSILSVLSKEFWVMVEFSKGALLRVFQSSFVFKGSCVLRLEGVEGEKVIIGRCIRDG